MYKDRVIIKTKILKHELGVLQVLMQSLIQGILQLTDSDIGKQVIHFYNCYHRQSLCKKGWKKKRIENGKNLNNTQDNKRIHTYIHTYIHVYVCVCVYIYIYIYVCVCVCACIYV